MKTSTHKRVLAAERQRRRRARLAESAAQAVASAVADADRRKAAEAAARVEATRFQRAVLDVLIEVLGRPSTSFVSQHQLLGIAASRAGVSTAGVYAQTLGIYNNEQNQYDMRDSLGTFLFQSFQNPLNRSAASWV